MAKWRVRRAPIAALAALILAALILAVLPGCAGRRGEVRRAIAESIVFAGSGTCRPLIELLAEDFVARNPGVNVDFLPVTHSSGGVSATASGTADIGMVSRELKDGEKDLGLEYAVLSDDGLTVAVDRRLGVKQLTSDQVRGIYSGAISNWSQVGGPDAPIIVLDRNEDESAKIFLRRHVLDQKGPLKLTPRAVVLYFEDEMVAAAEKTEGAIGYFSLGYATTTSVTAQLVELDGVAPTVPNIVKGDYRVVRPLGIVYPGDVAGAARRFIDYALGERAADHMARMGFAPRRR